MTIFIRNGTEFLNMTKCMCNYYVPEIITPSIIVMTTIMIFNAKSTLGLNNNNLKLMGGWWVFWMLS